MAPYGRQVDVSKLTDEECSKVIDVISKDILLRKSEKERIAYLNKRFEDFRRTVTIANTSRKKRIPFDDYCLICGKNLFTFICVLNLGEECISCENQCCRTCRKVLILEGDDWMDRCYICNICLEKRDNKRKSFEWFNEMVERRFKRFGSAKILRAIYKQRSTIEPRVITLLAHCRELQPTRRMSISSLQKRYAVVNYSKDDDKVTYSSSYSEVNISGKEPLLKGRNKYHSESEVIGLKEDITTSRSPSTEKCEQEKDIRSHSVDRSQTTSETPTTVLAKSKRKTSLPMKPRISIMEDTKESEDFGLVEIRKFSKVTPTTKTSNEDNR